jgi:hypothetical protein
MRRFLRGLWKVDLALTFAVVIALCVVEFSHSLPSYSKCCANNTPAQANLQTALTGAETYYASNNHSYVGIDGGPLLPVGVSSVAELDTGLKFIPGNHASTGPDYISIYTPSGSVLVMTAYSKGIQTCWGLLRVTRTRGGPYFPAYPATASVGTFYFHGGSSASADCMAAAVMPTALNTTGFPSA